MWHVHLPEGARRLLPRRAASLLPRELAAPLHGARPHLPRAALDQLSARLMSSLDLAQV